MGTVSYGMVLPNLAPWYDHVQLCGNEAYNSQRKGEYEGPRRKRQDLIYTRSLRIGGKMQGAPVSRPFSDWRVP